MRWFIAFIFATMRVLDYTSFVMYSGECLTELFQNFVSIVRNSAWFPDCIHLNICFVFSIMRGSLTTIFLNFASFTSHFFLHPWLRIHFVPPEVQHRFLKLCLVYQELFLVSLLHCLEHLLRLPRALPSSLTALIVFYHFKLNAVLLYMLRLLGALPSSRLVYLGYLLLN